MKNKIRKLAKDKNAIILAHNYQPPEIQDLADLCGDSLELSLRASQTGAEVIVFCGVHFMAETASIVCPEKTILLPKSDAGCPMADMVTPQGLEAEIKASTGIPVVTYVNSSAAVKAKRYALQVFPTLDFGKIKRQVQNLQRASQRFSGVDVCQLAENVICVFPSESPEQA